ncbi:MAG: Arc family DNA-binding protein [Cellulomonas sp.]|jgi:plasmid stability protein|nr:Arc family DNA-binding protein [Cellulomonas sp.]
MGQLLVRNLPDEVKEALRVRAAQHSRSMEAEARQILLDVVLPGSPVLTWLDRAAQLREQTGGVDLPAAARTASRAVEPW